MTTTLSIDIGGSKLKASLLDDQGHLVIEPRRIATPHPTDPPGLMAAIESLVAPLPHWDRIAAGFPGVVRHGIVRTAHNLGTPAFCGFDLARALAGTLDAPARVANDAEVQGLAAIGGTGVELVITLGTGFGSALFQDGVGCAHLELGHHEFHKGRTYEEALGDHARRHAGKRKWRRRLRRAIEQLRVLTTFDHLYIGGGNGRHVKANRLPPDVTVVDNTDGILGGFLLWRHDQP